MAEDYFDAYKRHLDDAERLYEADRLANASHLFGVSAECGLKYLISRFVNRSTVQKYHVCNSKFQSYYDSALNGYLALLPISISLKFNLVSFFSNWSVEDRYENQNDHKFDKANVDRHRKGANEVRALMNEAKKMGVM